MSEQESSRPKKRVRRWLHEAIGRSSSESHLPMSAPASSSVPLSQISIPGAAEVTQTLEHASSTPHLSPPPSELPEPLHSPPGPVVGNDYPPDTTTTTNMPPPPETPCKRIRVLRNEQCSPTYVLKTPPCTNWVDSVFQLRDTICDAFNDFTTIRMTDADKAAPETLLNTLGTLRLALTDIIEKVDNSCRCIVTYNPKLASELALQDKQSQTDSIEPTAPPPRRTYASAAISHTPPQEQPRPPPTTSRAKPPATKPTNPVRIVVQLKHFPTLPAQDLPARAIYQQLVTSCATIPHAPTPLGVHWNCSNNLIIAFPSGTSRTSIKTLFPSIHSLVGTDDPPVIRFDVPWRKVHLAGIHARNNPDQPITPVEELRQTLLLNPALQALKITIQPSWLKRPEAVSGTHTSAIIAFEDPDGSVERALLKSTLFAFGEAITVKKWHEKSPAQN